MGDALFYAVAFLGVLGVLILVHEYGHYVVAKHCGVKILTFSIGFGKPLVRWVRGKDQTEWVIGTLPLGGYVKMLDERETTVAPEEVNRSFNRQSVGRRSAIVAAGPAANLLLAFVIYVVLFWLFPAHMQAPNPQAYAEDSLPRLGKVMPGGPAERAGLLAGDDVLSVDGQAVDRWKEFVDIVRESPGKPLDLLLAREGVTLHRMVTPDTADVAGKTVGRIGVMVAPKPGYVAPEVVNYSLPASFVLAGSEVWDKSWLTLSMMGKMLIGEASWKNISGPVTIADYAGQTAKMGIPYYLKFMALLSISLGVLNLLPIPVLDGGHLMYHIFEVIRGGPLPEQWLIVGQRVGMAILFTLMAFAFFNDISRIFSG